MSVFDATSLEVEVEGAYYSHHLFASEQYDHPVSRRWVLKRRRTI